MYNKFHVVESTPVIDTAIYASGDQVGTLMTLTGVGEAGSGCILDKVIVIDKAKQKAALKVFLFDRQPTVASTDNTAANISDAEVVAKCIGVISVAAGDYSDLSANSTADVAYSKSVKPVGATMYALIVSGGTPTYTSASDLVIKFHFSWD